MSIHGCGWAGSRLSELILVGDRCGCEGGSDSICSVAASGSPRRAVHPIEVEHDVFNGGCSSSLHRLLVSSRRTREDVEMSKLRVRRSIGHEGAGEIVPAMGRVTNTQLNLTREWTPADGLPGARGA